MHTRLNIWNTSRSTTACTSFIKGGQPKIKISTQQEAHEQHGGRSNRNTKRSASKHQSMNLAKWMGCRACAEQSTTEHSDSEQEQPRYYFFLLGKSKQDNGNKEAKANWISPEASTFNPDVGEQHQPGGINVRHETWLFYVNKSKLSKAKLKRPAKILDRDIDLVE